MSPPSPATVTAQAEARDRVRHLPLVAEIDADVFGLEALADRVGVPAPVREGLAALGRKVEALREGMEGR